MTARDLTGRTYLITGGTSGIGEAAARLLAPRGPRIMITGRDATWGEAVRRDLEELGAHEAVFLPADLARFAEVERLARAISARTKNLDAVLHIAGVLHFQREETIDGCGAPNWISISRHSCCHFGQTP